MPSLRSSLIVYEGLPISSGGAHHIRERSPLRVWESLSAFLRDCADSVEFRSRRVAMYDDARSAADVARSAETADSLFGTRERRHFVLGAAPVDLITWRLQQEQLGEALAWVEEQQLPDTAHLGPALGVDIEAAFLLKDPQTGQTLPYQGEQYYGGQSLGRVPLGASAIYVRLSRRSTCSIDLSLPLENVDERARSFVELLSARLPFRLSSKHWTRMQLNKAGSHYCGRKVELP